MPALRMTLIILMFVLSLKALSATCTKTLPETFTFQKRNGGVEIYRVSENMLAVIKCLKATESVEEVISTTKGVGKVVRITDNSIYFDMDTDAVLTRTYLIVDSDLTQISLITKSANSGERDAVHTTITNLPQFK